MKHAAKAHHTPLPEAEPDFTALSRRLAKRAAEKMREAEPKADLTAFSLGAEAEHVEALRRYITAKEAIMTRFRDQLADFPVEIAALRDRLARETDPAAQTVLAHNLKAYREMQNTLSDRVARFEATWPDRKSDMQAAITGHEARRAAADGTI